MAVAQGRTDPIVTGVVVGVSAGLLIAANAKRTRLMIQNVDPTNNISILPVTSSITLTFGVAGSIRIAPAGSLVLDDIVCNSGFNAVSSAGTAKVSVWEF